ncbi:SMI1/KNR4 family protein [uncultured Enterococcus sp.]|uniref:SMI1/KNR4 family protein n=1 Tax=uncultured Enterococcus sp. TaxID=167972 RepID=UPI002AA6AC2B|nr:SMI1/KNR4 family protein [uncultured Enterococcus sp.]
MNIKVSWDFSKGPLTAQEINYVENQLEVKFPQDYIDVVSKHNGGFPEPDNFTVGTREEMMNNLINLKADADYNIFQMIDAVSDRLVSGLIPFGRDAGGNLICFDYRTNEVPTVVFWDHEIAGGGELERAITFVCDNFTEFLNMLHEPEDE